MSLWTLELSRLLPDSQLIARLTRPRQAGVLVTLGLTAILAGCGSSSSTSSSGLQAAKPAGTYNSYVGVSPLDTSVALSDPNSPANGGLWSGSFNDSTTGALADTFSLWNSTVDNYNTNTDGNGDLHVNGNFTLQAGFHNLNQTNDPAYPTGAAAGYALEIPGRFALVRQGSSDFPPIAMVASGCPSINGSTRFNFVTMSNDPDAGTAAYGSVNISTNGTTWNFSSYSTLSLSGAAAEGNGLYLPLGICSNTTVGSLVTIPSDVTQALPKSIAVGPSGFYVASLDYNGISYPTQVGIVEPSAALSSSDITSKNYLGFIYETPTYGDSLVYPEDEMASFGPSSPSGQLVGGNFSSDDPTQAASTNLTISLGSPDPKNNGLYPNVQVSNSDDGLTNSGVGVIGQVEGKYAIFISTQDGDSFGNLIPMGIYLIQQ